jgi:hypothetical protein
MSKLFHEAMTLEVKEDIQHRPIAFLYKGGKEGVEELCEQWRVSREWWKKATNTPQGLQSCGDPGSPAKSEIWQGGIEREYFRVRTVRGIVCEMYRDLITGAWYLQRIYD